MAATTYKDYIKWCEDNDGVRFSWNAWPKSKLEDERNVLPVSCLYTPLKPISLAPLPYSPVMCQNAKCRAILNPFCMNSVDFQSHAYVCALCHTRNSFPAQYRGMSPQHLPGELHATTVEYSVPTPTRQPLVFLLVVDTCLSEEEFVKLKASLAMMLTFLPSDALIGIITFNKSVFLHELVNKGIAMAWTFPGTSQYTTQQIQDYLRLGRGSVLSSANQNAPGGGGGHGVPHFNQAGGAAQHGSLPQHALPANRFFQPQSACDLVLSDLLERLQPDTWPVPQENRPIRALGSALSFAVGLAEVTYPNTPVRIMTFIGGPCTIGPGMVVDAKLANAIRSQRDIANMQAAHLKKASRHYEALANRAAQNNHIVDLFCCCLDQPGLYEMRYLTNYTGGHIVMGDSFNSILFQQTLVKVFQTDEAAPAAATNGAGESAAAAAGETAAGNYIMAFNAKLEVISSKELKLCGCIGSCFSCATRALNVSDNTEIGIGKTNTYRINALRPTSTLAFYFEVANAHTAPIPQGGRGLVQFVTQYLHSSGQRRIRVTTSARNWVDSQAQPHDLIASFDEEAATVLLARQAMFRAEEQDVKEVLRWLDQRLIRFCQKFAEYQKESVASFRFPAEFAHLAEFIFHLRRSPFLQVFNNSPDETAYQRHILNQEDCGNSLLMIQPLLISFNTDLSQGPVLVDSSSIRPDCILLMDTYFQLLIYHGQSIHQWIQQGYHEQEQYAGLKQMIEAPRRQAQEILKSRFPLPRYIETEHEGSQARFLLAKVNPSITHNTSMGYNQDNTGEVLTDDVSLAVFSDHLKKLAVTPNS